jgi:hypothetical protein
MAGCPNSHLHIGQNSAPKVGSEGACTDLNLHTQIAHPLRNVTNASNSHLAPLVALLEVALRKIQRPFGISAFVPEISLMHHVYQNGIIDLTCKVQHRSLRNAPFCSLCAACMLWGYQKKRY